MKSPTILPLSELDSGDSGTVVEISGGLGVRKRVEAMGIRPGKSITKISGMFMRGPVVARVDRMQVAIGWGMARKIIVQINHE